MLDINCSNTQDPISDCLIHQKQQGKRERQSWHTKSFPASRSSQRQVGCLNYSWNSGNARNKIKNGVQTEQYYTCNSLVDYPTHQRASGRVTSRALVLGSWRFLLDRNKQACLAPDSQIYSCNSTTLSCFEKGRLYSLQNNEQPQQMGQKEFIFLERTKDLSSYTISGQIS